MELKEIEARLLALSLRVHDHEQLEPFVLALQGQLVALDAFAYALIDSHPQPEKLLSALQSRIAQATRQQLPITPDAQRLRFELASAQLEDKCLAIVRARATQQGPTQPQPPEAT